MPKVTKKTSKEVKKKNPLLDADEDTSVNEEETADEAVSEDADEAEDEGAEEEAPVAPKKPVKAKVEAPVAPKVNIGNELQSDIRRTKAALDAEEKIRFFVPLFEGEKKGGIHQCFINGYMYPVKKGVMTEVPISIANLLADHYRITSEAGEDFRLDRDDKKADALS